MSLSAELLCHRLQRYVAALSRARLCGVAGWHRRYQVSSLSLLPASLPRGRQGPSLPGREGRSRALHDASLPCLPLCHYVYAGARGVVVKGRRYLGSWALPCGNSADVYLGPAGLECCWDTPPHPAWPAEDLEHWSHVTFPAILHALGGVTASACSE